MKPATVRDDAIDALKGLAIAGVLVLHSWFHRFDPGPLSVLVVARAWVQWCVPAFFFAAGLLARHPLDRPGVWRFTRTRAVRLLVPFVAFTLLYKLLQLPLAAAGLMPAWEWWSAGGPQLYFLPCLLAVSVLAAVVVAVVRGRPAWLTAALVGAAAVSAAMQPPGQTHGPHPALFGLYTANYLAGVVIAAGSPVVLAAGVLAAACAAAAWWTGNVNLLAGAAPAVLYWILRRAASAPVARPVVWLGRWSAVIFVWHTPLLMPAVSVLAVRLLGGGWPAIAVTFVVTVLGSVGLGWVAERWALLRPFRV
jgi:fucose 4-O-acetylase-like acetyltransferase